MTFDPEYAAEVRAMDAETLITAAADCSFECGSYDGGGCDEYGAILDKSRVCRMELLRRLSPPPVDREALHDLIRTSVYSGRGAEAVADRVADLIDQGKIPRKERG